MLKFALRLLLAASCAVGSAPLYADAANGHNLYLGFPSARFASGSHPCSACHDFTIADPIKNAAGKPAVIDSAINTEFAASRAMKPLYGANGESPLSADDIQDLADYIAVTVNGGGNATPAFQLTPATGAFASLNVGAQSPAITFTVTASNAGGTLTAATVSDTQNFAITGGTCLPMPHDLAKDASCTLAMVFTPKAAGAHSATLMVNDNGSPATLMATVNGAGATAGPGAKVAVVEFYNAKFHHYFITPNTTEIALLGKPPFEDWQPTGLSFNAYPQANPPAGTVGICRFFNDHFVGISTHFYAPHGLGCEQTITGFPDWTLEDPQLFYATLPNGAGACAAGYVPVYRVYNNGMGGAPNHRFTIDADVRQQMIDQGYVAEGYGIGVGWCAPQ
ncbi:MAG: choice-of-anchor D domain-containing protein [Casimicrobiaceae bacterium]